MLNSNTKSLGSLSLLELVHQPIHDVLEFIKQYPEDQAESIGHAVALACYLELSK